MKYIPIVALLAAGVGGYVVFSRRAAKAPTGIGPSGRWWGLKLLVAMVITVAVLVALIATFVHYQNTNP